MFKKQIITFFILLSFTLAVSAQDNAKKKADIDLIVKKSGIESQLVSIPTQVELGIMKYQQILGDKFEKVKAIYRKNLDVKNLTASIKEKFSKEYDEKLIADLIAFYNSKTAQKMTDLELAIAKDPKFQEKITTTKIEKFSAKRRELVASLLDSVKPLELIQKIGISTVEIFVPLNIVSPKENQLTKEQVESVKASLKTQFDTPDMFKYLQISFLLTYEKATDKELEEYATFWKKEAGLWMNNKIIDGIDTAFKAAAENITKELQTLVKK